MHDFGGVRDVIIKERATVAKISAGRRTVLRNHVLSDSPMVFYFKLSDLSTFFCFVFFWVEPYVVFESIKNQEGCKKKKGKRTESINIFCNIGTDVLFMSGTANNSDLHCTTQARYEILSIFFFWSV